MQKISPCLWFDDKAEEAAKFYTSNFKNSKNGGVTRYGKEWFGGIGDRIDPKRKPSFTRCLKNYILVGFSSNTAWGCPNGY
jgi:3-demethylubiquinone-9 3-methyltransferase